MRKEMLAIAVLLLLSTLALGLAGCERAKPAASPTREAESETPGASPTVAPGTSPEAPTTESPAPASQATPSPVSPQATEAPAPGPPSVPSEGTEYVVGWGDTIYLIASRHGVTVQDIVAANNLTDPDLIRAGDVLIIPGVAAPAPQAGVHIVRRGETLKSIAARYGTTVDAIAKANGIVNPNYIWVGQSLTIPGGTAASSGGQTYVVQRGDTLSSIAMRFGTTAWAIAYANNLPNVNIIYVGQTLQIP